MIPIIIIYLTDRVQPYEKLSGLLFSLIEEGNAEGVVSMISVAEVMQGPLRIKSQSSCKNG